MPNNHHLDAFDILLEVGLAGAVDAAAGEDMAAWARVGASVDHLVL